MPELTGIGLNMHDDGSHELVAASVAQGTGATMWHARQTSPSGSWTGWQPFGKPGHGDPGRPSIIQHARDGRLEVFVTSGDQAVWHRWQASLGPDDWSDWESLGKPGGQPAEGPVALTWLPDGQIMTVVTADGTVWQANSPGREPQAHWPAWSSLGRPGGATAIAVAAAANSDGRVELAALAEAGEAQPPPQSRAICGTAGRPTREPISGRTGNRSVTPAGTERAYLCSGRAATDACCCSPEPPMEGCGTKISTSPATPARGDRGRPWPSLYSASGTWPLSSLTGDCCSWSPQGLRAIVCGMRHRPPQTRTPGVRCPRWLRCWKPRRTM
jgi:hypothetical protein